MTNTTPEYYSRYYWNKCGLDQNMCWNGSFGNNSVSKYDFHIWRKKNCNNIKKSENNMIFLTCTGLLTFWYNKSAVNEWRRRLTSGIRTTKRTLEMAAATNGKEVRHCFFACMNIFLFFVFISSSNILNCLRRKKKY